MIEVSSKSIVTLYLKDRGFETPAWYLFLHPFVFISGRQSMKKPSLGVVVGLNPAKGEIKIGNFFLKCWGEVVQQLRGTPHPLWLGWMEGFMNTAKQQVIPWSQAWHSTIKYKARSS